MARKKQKTEPATATAAEVAEDSKPYEMVEESPMLTSRDVDAQFVDFDDAGPAPPTRGPMTGEVQMSLGQWLDNYATKEELAVFKASVQARLKKSETLGWTTFPDGRKIRASNKLAWCFSCRKWWWVEDPTGYCPGCNSIRRVGAGKLRAATADEERAWWAKAKADHAQFVADRPKREAEARQLDVLAMKLGGRR